MHTPDDRSELLLKELTRGPETDCPGIVPSRSGYDAAENLQKGAVAPIFSRLNAIYKKKINK